MKAPPGEGGLYPRGKGRWQAQATDPTGKRRSHNIRAKTWTEALELKRQWMRSLGALPPSPDVTFQAFYDEEWLPHMEARLARGDIRASTLAGYESNASNHLLAPLGHRPVAELKTRELYRVLDGVTGVSQQTLANVRRLLGGILAYAVEVDVIGVNPLPRAKGLKIRHAPFAYADWDLAKRIIDTFRDDPLEPFVIDAIVTGGRLSELARLDWEDHTFWTWTDADEVEHLAYDVHYHGGYHRDRRKRGYLEEPPKTEQSDRTVTGPEWAAVRMKALRGLGPIVAHRGERMKPDAIRDHYKERLADAGVPYISIRDLRHTHSMLLVDGGEDLGIVARRDGHSSTAITHRHYTVRSKAADLRAAGRLERLQSAATEGRSGSTRKQSEGA